MNPKSFDSVRVVSYFIWEYTSHENALSLWYCAEDMACFLEGKKILDPSFFRRFRTMDKNDQEYIDFVRHIAYRLFVYTGRHDRLANWFAAEKLICNHEWCVAICKTATIFEENKGDESFISGIGSARVRDYYDENKS